ncbi:MAG: hypothetical protein LN546_04505, partial [Rickettsia endosymbiont of Ecitomorpha arachnoides]|nr:hypothetical protein [Rickettsia endosymbiont of Ecitomorpha arachnoides]
FIQYFYFHYLLQYYHYSLPPYSEDITLILYQFLSVALYHFTSVANKVYRCHSCESRNPEKSEII